MSTPAFEGEAVSAAAAAAETGCCCPVQAGAKRAAKSHKGRRQMDDDFMIRLYKIKLCTRTTPHNWKLCPWAHPGETAALRRDPSSHMAEMCPAVRQHQDCPHGEGCLYARNTFECWLHPNRYRTTMCSSGEACNRNICFFAHNEQELRAPAPDVAQLWAGPSASAGADNQQLLLQDMSPAQAQQLVMGPAAAAGASGPLAGLMPGGTDMPTTGAGCGLSPADSFSAPLPAPSPTQAPWCAVVAPGSSTPLVAAAAVSPQAQQLQLQHALIQHQQLQAAGLAAPAGVAPASAPLPGLMYVPVCAGMNNASSAHAKQFSPAAPTFDVLATAGVFPEPAAARRSSNGLAVLNSAGPSPGNSAAKLPCLQPVAAAGDQYAQLHQAAVMQQAALLLQQLQLSGVMGHASCPQPSTDSLQSLLLGSSGTLPGLSHLSLSELSGEDNLTAFLPGSYPVTQDLPGVQAGRTAAALMQDTCLLPLESCGLIQLSALEEGPVSMAQHQQQVTLAMQQPNRFW